MSSAVSRSRDEHDAPLAGAQPPSRMQRWQAQAIRLFPAAKSLVRWVVPIAAVVLAGVAIAVLQRELSRYPFRVITRAIGAIPIANLALALLTTAACYAVLFWYDWLALAYVSRRLPVARTALASFIASAFSQGLGVSGLTGASVRFRFWSAWGLAPGEIARGLAFTASTFWLGALTMGGLALLWGGVPAAPAILPTWVGGILLLPASLYLVWVRRARGRGPMIIGSWSLRPPPVGLAVAQVVVASVDWILAGTVLYLLLHGATGIPLAPLLCAYLLAQVVALLSHVPGGVGVFEAAMMMLLRPYASTPTLAASLVAYRAIYYLLPLGSAAVTFAAYELALRRRVVSRALGISGRLIARLTPFWLSGATFLAGVVLLASGWTPSVHSRLRWLDAVFPLAVIELSHFAASVAGVILLLVANGLRRRLDAAWHVTVVLLVVGIAASLLKGGDYEEALTLCVVLGVVLPARHLFYRRAALFGEPLSTGWTVAVVLVIAGTAWLGFFSFDHVSYRASLWWQFAATADAPRVLRAMVGVAVVLIAYAFSRLLRPSRVQMIRPSADEMDRARAIVRRSRSSDASLALLGDKSILFSDSGRGFLMYAVHGRVWVALGGPIASPAEARELAWRFCELVDVHGGWPAFYRVGSDELPMYVDLGLSLVKLGEEARVPLTSFALDGGGRKGLRRALRDGERERLTFEIVHPPFAPALLDEAAAVSSAWLTERHTREKGFSLGFFDPAYLENFPLALVRRDGRLLAFANLWVAGEREELSVDLMRHTPDAPAGVMDFLFLRLMLWGRAQGFAWFNLGMAPLAGFETRALAPLWSRLGGLIHRHGEHFYNFRGLRQYKDKFDPVWTPMYLASPGAWVLPRVLTSVAALIAGGLRGMVAK